MVERTLVCRFTAGENQDRLPDTRGTRQALKSRWGFGTPWHGGLEKKFLLFPFEITHTVFIRIFLPEGDS
jgi:hypothetical protein